MGERLMIGAMSGTSADGVDAAMVDVNGHGLAMSITLMGHHHEPYDAGLRRAIFQVRACGNIALSDLADLGRQITLVYARAVNRLLQNIDIAASRVSAIAAHGQTLFHDPPLTIQWFDPSLLAWETDCAVVSDFRRADCAAGGQGAPLVPFADYILFGDPAVDRILLNIGGIANLTFVPANGGIEQLLAFDTGPGNCISDWICRRFHPDGPGWDVDGAARPAERSSVRLSMRFCPTHFWRRRPPNQPIPRR